MYVVDGNGNRKACPHPGELYTVRKVLGANASTELIKERTGFNSHCICLDCIEQFNLDLNRDSINCPVCQSEHVKSLRDMIGQTCPECREGAIQEIATGWMA